MKRNHNAFSLIELLVVITIVSVLITMLLPALSGARDMAKKTACTSNLRGIGRAIITYTLDFKDRCPIAADGVSRVGWDDLIYGYVGTEALKPSDMTNAWGWPSGLALKAFNCPASLIPPVIVTANIPAGVQLGTGQASYAMPGGVATPVAGLNYWQVNGSRCYGMVDANGYNPSNNTAPPWVSSSILEYRNSTSLQDPSGTMMLLEQSYWLIHGVGGQGTGKYCYSVDMQIAADAGVGSIYNETKILHPGKGLNYLFADGHVTGLIYDSVDVIGTGTTANPKGIWSVLPSNR